MSSGISYTKYTNVDVGGERNVSGSKKNVGGKDEWIN